MILSKIRSYAATTLVLLSLSFAVGGGVALLVPDVQAQQVPTVTTTADTLTVPSGADVNVAPGSDVTIQTEAEDSTVWNFGAIVAALATFVAGVLTILLRTALMVGFERLERVGAAYVDGLDLKNAREALQVGYDKVAAAARARMMEELGKIPMEIDLRHPIVAQGVRDLEVRLSETMRKLNVSPQAAASALIDRIVGDTAGGGSGGEMLTVESLRDTVSQAVRDTVAHTPLRGIGLGGS
jgi:hypothetical protein